MTISLSILADTLKFAGVTYVVLVLACEWLYPIMIRSTVLNV